MALLPRTVAALVFLTGAVTAWPRTQQQGDFSYFNFNDGTGGDIVLYDYPEEPTLGDTYRVRSDPKPSRPDSQVLRRVSDDATLVVVPKRRPQTRQRTSAGRSSPLLPYGVLPLGTGNPGRGSPAIQAKKPPPARPGPTARTGPLRPVIPQRREPFPPSGPLPVSPYDVPVKGGPPPVLSPGYGVRDVPPAVPTLPPQRPPLPRPSPFPPASQTPVSPYDIPVKGNARPIPPPPQPPYIPPQQLVPQRPLAPFPPAVVTPISPHNIPVKGDTGRVLPVDFRPRPQPTPLEPIPPPPRSGPFPPPEPSPVSPYDVPVKGGPAPAPLDYRPRPPPPYIPTAQPVPREPLPPPPRPSPFPPASPTPVSPYDVPVKGNAAPRPPVDYRPRPPPPIPTPQLVPQPAPFPPQGRSLVSPRLPPPIIPPRQLVPVQPPLPRPSPFPPAEPSPVSPYDVPVKGGPAPPPPAQPPYVPPPWQPTPVTPVQPPPPPGPFPPPRPGPALPQDIPVKGGPSPVPPVDYRPRPQPPYIPQPPPAPRPTSFPSSGFGPSPHDVPVKGGPAPVTPFNYGPRPSPPPFSRPASSGLILASSHNVPGGPPLDPPLQPGTPQQSLQQAPVPSYEPVAVTDPPTQTYSGSQSAGSYPNADPYPSAGHRSSGPFPGAAGPYRIAEPKPADPVPGVYPGTGTRPSQRGQGPYTNTIYKPPVSEIRRLGSGTTDETQYPISAEEPILSARPNPSAGGAISISGSPSQLQTNTDAQVVSHDRRGGDAYSVAEQGSYSIPDPKPEVGLALLPPAPNSAAHDQRTGIQASRLAPYSYSRMREVYYTVNGPNLSGPFAGVAGSGSGGIITAPTGVRNPASQLGPQLGVEYPTSGSYANTGFQPSAPSLDVGVSGSRATQPVSTSVQQPVSGSGPQTGVVSYANTGSQTSGPTSSVYGSYPVAGSAPYPGTSTSGGVGSFTAGGGNLGSGTSVGGVGSYSIAGTGTSPVTGGGNPYPGVGAGPSPGAAVPYSVSGPRQSEPAVYPISGQSSHSSINGPGSSRIASLQSSNPAAAAPISGTNVYHQVGPQSPGPSPAAPGSLQFPSAGPIQDRPGINGPGSSRIASLQSSIPAAAAPVSGTNVYNHVGPQSSGPSPAAPGSFQFQSAGPVQDRPGINGPGSSRIASLQSSNPAARPVSGTNVYHQVGSQSSGPSPAAPGSLQFPSAGPSSNTIPDSQTVNGPVPGAAPAGPSPSLPRPFSVPNSFPITTGLNPSGQTVKRIGSLVITIGGVGGQSGGLSGGLPGGLSGGLPGGLPTISVGIADPNGFRTGAAGSGSPVGNGISQPGLHGRGSHGFNVYHNHGQPISNSISNGPLLPQGYSTL